MSRRLMIGMAVVALLTLTACAGSDSEGSSGSSTTEASTVDPSTLDGSTYVSTGSSGMDLVAGTSVTMTFSDGDLTVNGGCNTISSSYDISGNTLSFTGEPRSTMMACDQDLTDQDQFLITWLNEGVQVEQSPLGLTVAGSGVTIDFSEGGANVDPELVGPLWTLESTTQGEVVTTVATSAQAPTLEFAADGAVNVFTGCNSGGASVSTGTTTLTFGPLRLTKMACDDASTALETAMVAVLDGEVLFTLDGSQLLLTKDATTLTFAGG